MQQNDKLCAINSVTKLLKGSYALAILFDDEPEKIYFARGCYQSEITFREGRDRFQTVKTRTATDRFTI